MTQDVDVTLLCGLGEEAAAIDWLLAQFPARLPDARDFALRNRVLLLRTDSGVPIDVSLGAIPLEHRRHLLALVRVDQKHDFVVSQPNLPVGLASRTCGEARS